MREILVLDDWEILELFSLTSIVPGNVVHRESPVHQGKPVKRKKQISISDNLLFQEIEAKTPSTVVDQ